MDDPSSGTRPIRTIADFSGLERSIGAALLELADVTTRGLRTEEPDELIPWSHVLREARLRVALALGTLGACAGGAPSSGIPSAPPLLPHGHPQHIGLLLENTPEYVYWLCAAAISPLVVVGLNDTRAPASLARDVETADVGLVVYDAGHAELAGQLASHTAVPVVPADEALAGAGDATPDGALADGDVADPDGLVALVFTSGSTGDPKAVRITQRKIAAPAAMLAERFGLGASDCIYNAMPLFHSNAVLVAWPIAVFTGCDLALRRRFSASRWLADVRRHGATFANYVGTPLSYILSTPERPDDAENPVRIVYGNEAGEDVRRRFSARFGVRVVDGFGSTEGGVAVSRTPETPPAALGPLPAGASVIHPETGAECAAARFSSAGALENAGEAVGELVGSGPGLFAGYYENPEADAERMRDGLFHTGDLAYVDAQGFVYFAGRASTWMRVAGENLAATPIERTLSKHPWVAEVSVYGIPAAEGPGDEVAATVVLAGGAGPAGGDDTGKAGDGDGEREDGTTTSSAERFAAGLREFLAAQPDLSVRQWPALVRVVASMPRTPSFKVRTAELVRRGRTAAGDLLFFRGGPARSPGEYGR